MDAILFTRLKTALVNMVFIASTQALLLPAADRYTLILGSVPEGLIINSVWPFEGYSNTSAQGNPVFSARQPSFPSGDCVIDARGRTGWR